MTPIASPKRNISITILLASAIGGLVFLAVGVVLALSVYSNFTNTTELLRRSSNQLISSIEQRVTTHIDPVRFVVEHIKQQVLSGSIDFSDKFEMVASMKAAFAAAPNLTGVVIWHLDGHEILVIRAKGGKFVVSSREAFEDPDFRQHFGQLKPDNSGSWERPWREDGRTLLTYTTGIFKDGKKIGGVGAGISITNLSRVIGKMENDTGFSAFVLYGNDHILAHKTLPEISTASISKAQPLLAANKIKDGVLAKFGSTTPGTIVSGNGLEVRNIQVENRVFLTLSRPFSAYGSKPWNIGAYAPRNQLLTQVRRLMKSFAAGILMLVLSIIAAIYLASRMARPIKVISKAATDISSLEFGSISVLPNSHITEINNQSKAFNQMLEGLKWFEAYVPRKLVQSLMKQQSDEAVTSRQEELTVMFTDLIGFTKMSENLAPSDTADMLNEHFSLVNKCIEDTDGTLDKYIGDAVMAFWGAPEPQDDHALRSCEAALCITERMAAESTGLRMKIAIHSGPLIVGNIGAPGRMNYTVIGDTVNTCSRIEKLAGELDDGSKVFTLLSEQVAHAVGDRFKTRPAGEFSVKGRSQTVKVYQLIGRV